MIAKITSKVSVTGVIAMQIMNNMKAPRAQSKALQPLDLSSFFFPPSMTKGIGLPWKIFLQGSTSHIQWFTPGNICHIQ